MYSIWLLEYGHVYKQPVGSVLAGQHNKGFRELSFTYMLVQGNGHNILIDTGTNGEDETTKKLHERDDVHYWQSPEHILKKVGLTPDDIDYVLITHAHYDHMDNLKAFKNAQFVIQKNELLGWVEAMVKPPKFRAPHMALKPDNIFEALGLAVDGRMTLVEGEVKNILDDIDLIPAYDGHTFASQIVMIHNPDANWFNVGDIAYVNENFTGIGGDGVYVPVGLGVGTQYHMIETLDDLVKRAEGKLDQIIIGHETSNWEKFPSKKYEDNLWVAEISLADGTASKIN